jgi:Alpha amylase, catalytic domain/Transposase DDE domain group 1
LRGVIDHIDYIKDLAADAVYLTPIFTAYSNHKYDTVDYQSVDPMFGDESVLGELIDELHKRGMRLIMDAVLNHVGTEHPWFQAAKRGEVPFHFFRGREIFVLVGLRQAARIAHRTSSYRSDALSRSRQRVTALAGAPHHDERGFASMHIYHVASGTPVVAILRPARTPKGTEVRTVIKHVTKRLRRYWPNTRIVWRGDSHYGRVEAMDWAEDNDTEYIFGVAGNAVLMPSWPRPPTICVSIMR